MARARLAEGALPRGAKIIHEDDALLVVEKPAGLLTSIVQDGAHREGEPNLFGLVKDHLRGRRKGSARTAWIVHRLDKDVSGLLVFAKNHEAFTWLKEDFRQKRVDRVYVAVVEGAMGDVPPPRPESGVDLTVRRGADGVLEGSIRSRLAERHGGLMGSVGGGGGGGAGGQRAGRSSGRRDVDRDEQDEDDDRGDMPAADAGKLAVTHWRVIATGRGCTALAITLETGRKNQIRVHCRDIGHAIVGDRRYGAASDPLRRICLHATTLGFRHPASGEAMRFVCPPPESFARLAGVSQARFEQAVAPAAQRLAIAPSNEAQPAPSASSPPTPLEPQPKAALNPGLKSGLKPGPNPALKPTPGRGPEAPGHRDSWDHVAGWYDDLIGERGSDHHEQVIVPGALRLLGPARGMRMLDLACGQGAFAHRLASLGVEAVGIDSSPRLIDAARRSVAAGRERGRGRELALRFEVGDARALDVASLGGAASFDAVTCIMALMNIEPLEPLLRTTATLLKPGGSFVAVLLHPAFRSPGQTSWGWSDERGEGEDAPPRDDQRDDASRDRRTDARGEGRRSRSSRFTASRRGGQHGERHGREKQSRQYRRVDAYLSPAQREIVMNPGAAASGAAAVVTTTYHRPLQSYVRLLAAAGLSIVALEEWPSMRSSQPGPRAAEENRARREIPMFAALQARRGAG